MRKNIVLMTDFGYKDNYVGLIKGVILNIAPDTNILDLTHNIQAQNIKQAAFILNNSMEYFPKDSIFLSVIDPGVGSERKAIAVKTENFYFVAPDNGILTYALEKEKIIEIAELTNPKYHLRKISNTFHGRDIFAPVSAYLSKGIAISNFGYSLDYYDITKIGKPYFLMQDNSHYSGEVIYIDNFGNLITSLKASEIGLDISNLKDWTVEIGKHKIKGISETFSEVNENQLLAYIGSFGYIEIALRNGNASEYLGINNNSKIFIYKNNHQIY